MKIILINLMDVMACQRNSEFEEGNTIITNLIERIN